MARVYAFVLALLLSSNVWSAEALVQQLRQEGGGAAFDGFIEVWRLIAPTNNTGDITVTFDASDSVACAAYLMNGAHQTTPNDTIQSTGAAANTTISDTISSATDEIVFDFLTHVDGEGTSPVCSPNQTGTRNSPAPWSNNQYDCYASGQEVGATTSTMGWDQDGAADAMVIMVWNVKPCAACTVTKGDEVFDKGGGISSLDVGPITVGGSDKVLYLACGGQNIGTDVSTASWIGAGGGGGLIPQTRYPLWGD